MFNKRKTTKFYPSVGYGAVVRGFGAVIFLMMFSASLWAVPADVPPNKQPVAVTLTLKRIVIDAKGREKREDVQTVKPGDLLEYTAVYSNVSKNDVADLAASLPVPTGLEYVGQSARPQAVQASANGVVYGAEPLMTTQTNAQGKTQQVAVPLSDYRSLRWQVGKLGAGKKIQVSARMRVSQTKTVDLPLGKSAPSSSIR